MNNITNFDVLAPEIEASFTDRLLAIETPNLMWKLAATPFMQPRNGGTVWRTGRYNNIEPFTTPLGTSGINPPPEELTRVDIDATPQAYGAYFALQQQTTLQIQDGALNSAVQVLGIALRKTEDILCRDALVAGAGQIDCSGGGGSDDPTPLSRSDINQAVRTLINNNAWTIADVIGGLDKFGTAPIRESYFVFAHSNLVNDIEAVNGFKNKAEYPSQDRVNRAEWGAVGNSRWFTSTLGSITPNASSLDQDVYNNIFVGLESYGCIVQDGATARFMYLPPFIAGGPLGLYGTAGVSFMEVCRGLNDKWYLNLRSTASY